MVELIVGSLPPVKARRRQNAIDNLAYRNKRRCTAYNKRASTGRHTDLESGEEGQISSAA
nr:MAG TPA: hypothetical protein [Caudoviricetes sp.]